MIISHKLKVIYIKLAKVAGTSFEIALSKYCGADDIITSIVEDDEAIRKSLGFHSAQNYMDPKTQSPLFYNHISAEEIKQKVAEEVWNNYLKIATIRCPYDMRVSGYYFSVSEEQKKDLSFEQFIADSSKGLAIKCLCGLHIDGKIAADFLIRYEHLSEDIKDLETKIDCPNLLKTFEGIQTKQGHRPKIASKQAIYSKYPNAKLIMDKICNDYSDTYEFFQKYWPMYKADLERALE